MKDLSIRVLAALCGACLAGCAGDEESARPPSIVFVSIDTLAAGHTSLHGYERDTTPFLRSLAGESIVFEAAWANAAWTTPSYMAQFTGLLPEAHRIIDEDGTEVPSEAPWFLADERVTLAEALQGAGYRTAAFVDNPNIEPHLGFGQGFELYDTLAIDPPDTAGIDGLRLVSERGLAWLEAVGDERPRFLFLQALDPHAPYEPHPEFLGHFEGQAVEAPLPSEVPVAEDWNAIFRAIPRYVVLPYESEGQRPPAYDPGPLVDAYDREIAATDAALGALVEDLRRRGVLDEAILVVSADHGESMLEEGSFFSHQSVQEEVLHVPLLVRLPGGAHGGRRVSAGVELVDLFPTLLELAGVDPVAANGVLHGRSLAPALGPTVSLSDEVLQYATANVFRAEAVRRGPWKLSRGQWTAERENVRALLSLGASAGWLESELGLLPGRVVGTRALGLGDFLEGLPVGREHGVLLDELQVALAQRGPRLQRLEGGRLRDVDPGAFPEVVEDLVEALERRGAEARAARVRGVPTARPAVDAARREALDQLGY